MNEHHQRTWDGLPITPEDPMGATIVVHRQSRHGTEVLLLHRAHHGPDFDADWAWTPPSGCRQPGESVQAAARRELAEEAGLDDLPIESVDLMRPATREDGTPAHWALFVAEAPADVQVRLVDAEHDRFVWVSPERAAQLLKPPILEAFKMAVTFRRERS